MKGRMNTELGSILIDKDVIATYAGSVAVECFGKQHTHLLVTRKVAHEHVVTLFLYAETAQQGCGVALGIPPFEFSELFLQFRGADAIGVREIWFGIQGVLFLHYIP